MLAMNPSSPDAKPLQLVPLKQRLTKAVAKEHAFLREVDELADVVYDEDVIRVAALRYERLWIPAVAALTRYFSDWEHLAGTVPTFVFPGARSKLPDGAPPGLNANIDLANRSSALESMWRSLGEDVEAANATDLARAVKAQPASQLSYDVAAAALRQRVFFYQVSLPHYQDAAFIRQAVNRYITFLGIRQANPGTKLCPTYDIDLVWHSHMSLPHQYKADTKALLGMHLPHDDSITDRSDGSELQDVQRATERLFEEAGEQFFQAGGMFRGIPTRLTPEQREACCPEAPPSSVKLSLKYVEWKPSSDGGATEALLRDRQITAWSLRKGSGDGSFWRRSRNSQHLQAAAETLEATSAALHTLRIRVEEHASKSSSKSVSTASVVINLGIMLQGSGMADSQQVEVLVPVGRKAGRCTAVLTLQLTKHFHSVACRGPMTLDGWPRASDQPLSPWVQSSAAYVNAEHASAAAHVTQPELLLPVSAVNDKGNDAAETRSFLMPVQGGMHEDSFAGALMLVRHCRWRANHGASLRCYECIIVLRPPELFAFMCPLLSRG